MAGVTRRTLHYYDAIGLLSPSRAAENGYRKYSEADLLRLQQILLFRETGLPLEKICQILDDAAFDSVTSLKAHRDQLLKEQLCLGEMINTVEKTIQYLQGDIIMKPPELFKALSPQEEHQNEQEALRMYDPKTVKESARRWKSYSAIEKEKIMAEGNAIFAAIVEAMPKGADSPEAQAGIVRWRKHMTNFWTPGLEQLIDLAALYSEDARFKANFDKIHPDLAAFMREAVGIYVERQEKNL